MARAPRRRVAEDEPDHVLHHKRRRLQSPTNVGAVSRATVVLTTLACGGGSHEKAVLPRTCKAHTYHLCRHADKPDLRRQASDAQQLVNAEEGEPENREHNRLRIHV